MPSQAVCRIGHETNWWAEYFRYYRVEGAVLLLLSTYHGKPQPTRCAYGSSIEAAHDNN